jgi:hypothetical protein
MGEKLFGLYKVMDETAAKKANLSELVKTIIINELLMNYAPDSVGAGIAHDTNKILYAELDRREEMYKSK